MIGAAFNMLIPGVLLPRRMVVEWRAYHLNRRDLYTHLKKARKGLAIENKMLKDRGVCSGGCARVV